ncbi:hypothetical protein [Gloeothece verrucosa]|uniref:Uncharacterized protein n=1 Tax=Gloeothece verrucosa (strain PCC 7822) TaxID=497965 RepID=E0U5I7_GLOV7|nr:hypothetical protein [Gloeothece verrucosa]ADN14700.1 conserved hypothetical protein [Gloeothece verrucosa PCC 7822]
MILHIGRGFGLGVSPVSNLERIESIKAGIIGGFTFTSAYLLVTLLNSLSFSVEVVFVGVSPLLKVAIAFLSGFLFGITYRYIIRSDENSHLKDGAVLAFGLVRGLAPIEAGSFLLDDFWLLSLLGVESIVCFAITRLILDVALDRQWVKPFKS